MTTASSPEISVVILNYNGARWIERCLESIRKQTLFDRIEVIVADNRSSDGSDEVAARILEDWPNGRLLRNGENLGYCEGNNRGARVATGRFLFFLNNDTWLEPACLEELLKGTEAQNASAGTPLVLNFDSNHYQWVFAAGFDLFGFPSFRIPPFETSHLFMPPGCSYLIESEFFHATGGFDSTIFMYADELDLSWRLWLSGRKAVVVPGARLHHRGAVHVNPRGEANVVEFRTSDAKRFYSNRNGLLVLLKNCQHVLLLMVPLQCLLLCLEAMIGLLLVRRWSFIRRAYIEAFVDCWRQRKHIRSERRRIRAIRRRSDWWMLRFLRLRLNRWDELGRLRRYGLPKVTKG